MLEIIFELVYEIFGDFVLEIGAWTIGKILCMLADLIKAIGDYWK